MAATGLSTREALRERLDPLLRIGRSDAGTTRLAWTAEQHAAEDWFRRQADAVGLTVEVDPAGNLWARPSCEPPWWAVGSHLDSVERGGSYDGALGVAAGFQVAATSSAPLAVVCFADEEGARFNTPTFGSRALVGRLDCEDVRARRDRDGVSLAAAMAEYGLDPLRLGQARDWLARLAGFVEIHVDQTMQLADAGQPVGVIAAAVARVRLEVAVVGAADHAGTTPPAQRRDALSAAARLIIAAEEAAGADMITTATRIEVEPNATTTVPSRARVWLDARAPEEADLDHWIGAVHAAVDEVERARGLRGEIATRSRSPRVGMDEALAERLRLRAAERGLAPPTMLSYAGHDACMLAPHVPAAMVIVRNSTGVSHAPEETLALDDAAVAIELVTEELGR